MRRRDFTEFSAAQAGLQRFFRQRGATVVYEFYSGELAHLTGNLAAAAGHYQRALDLETPAYSRPYQLFSAIRLAEVKGRLGDYNSSRKILKRALELRQKEPLIGLLLKARERFYQHLADGESDQTPSLVLAPDTSSSASAPATSGLLPSESNRGAGDDDPRLEQSGL